ncbi:hypothetical protein H5410_060321 [Solanum commersonii]|uniref:Uncharacterized protein n=1 Tax=Solanum commersonii TaxID=4109 RepID=A0A9J5W4S1_SOLCO|nr:hypothetical protein H5410_060321 [Solanum commersonii]
MLPHVFDELGSIGTRTSAKDIGTIAREMTHVRKKENESDPDVWVEERVERTFAVLIWKEKWYGDTQGRCYGLGSQAMLDLHGLEGIGSSRQVRHWRESGAKRVEQQSMSETVQQIKEQVMNLALLTYYFWMTSNVKYEDDYILLNVILMGARSREARQNIASKSNDK